LKEGVVYLSKFIASDYFSSLKSNSAGTAAVDTIYLRSLHYFNNDFSEAMLALVFVLIPYDEITIKFPLLNFPMTIHLPVAPEPLFTKKTKNTPSIFFPDSPIGMMGDKDKLPHFFGTAFIEYNFPFFNLSKFLGIFVEKFEESFFLQGAMDKRDLYVNRLGAKFGRALRTDGSRLPSEFLNKYSYSAGK